MATKKTVTATDDSGKGVVSTAVESGIDAAPAEFGKNIFVEAGAPTYTPEEYVKAAHKIFGRAYSRDTVLVALKLAGKEAYTKSEAEAVVKAFANKEV